MRCNVQQREGYSVGFIDRTISEVYRRCPSFFHGLSVFITRLDSSSDLRSLTKWCAYLEAQQWRPRWINNAVWIPWEGVATLFRDGRTFFGFDSIWLLLHKPTAVVLPKANAFTSDGYNFSKEAPEELFVGLKALGATRYLADGCGLNFACESSDVAAQLLDALT